VPTKIKFDAKSISEVGLITYKKQMNIGEHVHAAVNAFSPGASATIRKLISRVPCIER